MTEEQQPQEGGSYRRSADGSLIQTRKPTQAPNEEQREASRQRMRRVRAGKEPEESTAPEQQRSDEAPAEE